MARITRGNWIVTYSTAMDKISEAPRQYNVWAALATVGAVLKNKVYIRHGTYTLYPNQYIVLVGPPGVGKGTAIHPAFDFPKRLNLINVISDRITAPKIIERLASGFPGQVQATAGGAISMGKDGSATLFSTELATLITSSDWMLQFLCDAWDRNEFFYDTKNSGSATVKGMCTSLIGACVPEYIRKLNKDATAAINGGFTARTVFVYAEEKSKKIPWPLSLEDTAQGRALIQGLEEDLKTIAGLAGRFTISPDAAFRFEKFYRKLQAEETDSDVIVHFKSRMHVHVLKLSMIFSCAERDDLIVDATDMSNAITCLQDVLANLDKAFRGVGDSELAENTARVQNFIEKRGITNRSEILQNLHRHINPDHLDRILALLCNINFCLGQSAGGRYTYKFIGKKGVVSTTPLSIKL
jgi:Protein of unknown function (DUF3987)